MKDSEAPDIPNQGFSLNAKNSHHTKEFSNGEKGVVSVLRNVPPLNLKSKSKLELL